MTKYKSKNREEVISLAKKINELAERGVGGEKDVAIKKLKNLLAEYGLTYSDFKAGKNVGKREFKVKDFKYYRKLLCQCIFDTKPDAEIHGSLKAKKVYCELTDEEYIEVVDKYNHYICDYEHQIDAFFTAYVVKNELGLNAQVKEENAAPIPDGKKKKEVNKLMGVAKKNLFINKNLKQLA